MRTDTYDLDTRLRAALDAHVADGTPANSNYSVRLSDPPERAARPLKRLYRGSALEVASRSPQRVLDALLAGLSTWALRERGDLIEVRAIAAVGAGRAALLPASLAAHTPALERRLARDGVSLVDAPVAHLDAASGEAVVAATPLDVDWTPLDALVEGDARPASEGPPVTPGRYPLACWLLPAPDDGDRPSDPAADPLVRAARLVTPPTGMAAPEVVGTLAAALAHAHSSSAPMDPAELAEAVTAALAR